MRFFFLTISCLLLSACGSSQGQADFQLALQYLSGNRVTQSDAKGIELLQKAAKAGNADAELTLGFFHAKGQHGLKEDTKIATDLFLRAAKHGSSDAQYNIGLAYVRGDGVTQDYKEALQWFLKAAEQNDAGAQYNAGVMYLSGEGTAKDPLLAYTWFSLASDNGFVGASDGMNDAKHEMTEEQVKEIPATRARIEATVKKPAKAQTNTEAMPL